MKHLKDILNNYQNIGEGLKLGSSKINSDMSIFDGIQHAQVIDSRKDSNSRFLIGSILYGINDILDKFSDIDMKKFYIISYYEEGNENQVSYYSYHVNTTTLTNELEFLIEETNYFNDNLKLLINELKNCSNRKSRHRNSEEISIITDFLLDPVKQLKIYKNKNNLVIALIPKG